MNSTYDVEDDYFEDFDTSWDNYCYLCDNGLLKLEFIHESEDNYCTCELGDKRRYEKEKTIESKVKKFLGKTPTPEFIKNVEKLKNEPPVQRCKIGECGGIIIGYKEEDTPNRPGEWYAICNKCGAEPNE
jgi:hypothetical protein